MGQAVHPFITACVAVLGAGVIAVSPVAPPPPDMRSADIQIDYPAVQLALAGSPIEFYAQVAFKALGNAGSLVQRSLGVGGELIALSTDPMRVLEGTILSVVFLATPFVAVPIISLAVEVASAISPLANGIGAVWTTIGDIVFPNYPRDPVTRIIEAFEDVIAIPARIIDGILNGGYPFLGSLDAGLLSPHGPLGNPLTFAAWVLGDPLSLPTTPTLQPAATTPTTDVSLTGSASPLDQEGAAVRAAAPAAAAPDHLTEVTTGQSAEAEERLDTVVNEPAPAVDGLGEPTTDEPEQADEGPDEATPERSTGGTDLTDGNKVDPGDVATATTAADKTGVDTDVQERAETQKADHGSVTAGANADNASSTADTAPAPTPDGE